MIKNKKADLFDNALETIVAVLGIALLLFGVGYVGYKFLVMNQNQESENVKTMLNSIEAKANAMKANQNTTLILQETNDEWYLMGWSKTAPADTKPEKCFLNSCICMCQKPDLNSCQANGICRKLKINQINIVTYRQDVKVFPTNPFDYDTGVRPDLNYIIFKTAQDRPQLIEVKLSMVNENSLLIFKQAQ